MNHIPLYLIIHWEYVWHIFGIPQRMHKAKLKEFLKNTWGMCVSDQYLWPANWPNSIPCWEHKAPIEDCCRYHKLCWIQGMCGICVQCSNYSWKSKSRNVRMLSSPPGNHASRQTWIIFKHIRDNGSGRDTRPSIPWPVAFRDSGSPNSLGHFTGSRAGIGQLVVG